MDIRPLLLATTLLLCPLAGAGEREHPRQDDARPPAADPRQDCEETDECFVDGIELSPDQQQQVRDILQAASRQQEDLRDDTVHRLQQVLTPEQARQLDERRSGILDNRAKRLRQRARQMEHRARDLKDERQGRSQGGAHSSQ